MDMFNTIIKGTKYEKNKPKSKKPVKSEYKVDWNVDLSDLGEEVELECPIFQNVPSNSVIIDLDEV